jgi:hypothetical protein
MKKQTRLTMLSTNAEDDVDRAKEKYLAIAYREAMVDQNNLLLNILREKKVIFGPTNIYIYNCIITYSYFLERTDIDARSLLYQVIVKLSTTASTFTYGDPFEKYKGVNNGSIQPKI